MQNLPPRPVSRTFPLPWLSEEVLISAKLLFSDEK